jgi:hypothetical protein
MGNKRELLGIENCTQWIRVRGGVEVNQVMDESPEK